MKKSFLSALSLCLLFSFGAQAQSAQQNQAQAQAQQAANVEVTKKDMKKFKEVQPKIEKIVNQLRTQIQKADSQEAAKKVQMEYQQKMVKKVMKSGLSINKYNAIAQGQRPQS